MTNDSRTLAALRRLLLAAVLAGSLGMGAELLLVGHVEEVTQLIPVVLLGLAVPVLAWQALAPRRSSVRAVQVVMSLFVISGLVGVALHYQGNAEFELEMYPTMAGTELIAKTLTGATPVLAPGSMVLLGIVGIAHTYQYPMNRN